MGFTLSKTVDLKMPIGDICTKSQHRFHCGPDPRFYGPHGLRRQKRKKPLKTATSTRQLLTPSAGGDIAKSSSTPSKLEEPSDVLSSPSVLVVEEGDVDDSDDEDFSYQKGSKARKYAVDRNLLNFEREFEEVDSLLESNFYIDNQDENGNMRKFVKEWKFALAGYPNARVEKVCSDIPLAATSICKQGITRMRRCHRCCLKCASAAAAEFLFDDLLHKESLDRFRCATEFEQVTSSIIIRDNVKRKMLYEIVKSPDEQEETGEEEEEDLFQIINAISQRIILERPPADNLIRLPSPEVLHQNYDRHHLEQSKKIEKEGLEKGRETINSHHRLQDTVDKVLHHFHPDREYEKNIVPVKVASSRNVGSGSDHGLRQHSPNEKRDPDIRDHHARTQDQNHQNAKDQHQEHHSHQPYGHNNNGNVKQSDKKGNNNKEKVTES